METTEQIAEKASKLAGDILRALGFECTVEIVSATAEEISLAISSPDSRFIIGESGTRLDDLQYIVNRLIVTTDTTAPRVRIDCNNYRSKAEDRLINAAIEKAQRVIATGKPFTMSPMNAYHRRLIHTALADIPGVTTQSEDIDARFKRIIISPSS